MAVRCGGQAVAFRAEHAGSLVMRGKKAPLDPDDDLIKMPFAGRSRAAASDIGSKLVPEAANPITDRFMGHRDATCCEEVFHIAKAQGEAMIGPDSVPGDVPQKPEAPDPRQIHEVQRPEPIGAKQRQQPDSAALRKVAAPVADGSLWAEVQALLHHEDGATYGAWFHCLTEIDVTEGCLSIAAPTRFQATYIKTHLMARLLAAVRRVAPHVHSISIES